MTQLSRMNKSQLVDKLTHTEVTIKQLQEQRTALVVVLAITLIVNLLF